jgi:hypothetical protein
MMSKSRRVKTLHPTIYIYYYTNKIRKKKMALYMFMVT